MVSRTEQERKTQVYKYQTKTDLFQVKQKLALVSRNLYPSYSTQIQIFAYVLRYVFGC